MQSRLWEGGGPMNLWLMYTIFVDSRVMFQHHPVLYHASPSPAVPADTAPSAYVGPSRLSNWYSERQAHSKIHGGADECRADPRV